jgi:Aldehyde dehydrogenase family
MTGVSAEVIDPSNGTVVATITLGGVDDVGLAVPGRDERLPRLVRATPGERSGVLARFARLLEARAEEIAQMESRQAGNPSASPGNSTSPAPSSPRHHRQRRLLLRRRAQSRGQGHRRVLRRPHLQHPAGTGRRHRIGLTVELPAADGSVEGPSGHRGRQHHRAETGRDHPADHPPVRRDRHGGRGSGRRGQHRQRRGTGRRRGTAAIHTSPCCRSPVPRRWAGRCFRPPPPRPSGCIWSWAEKSRSWCSTTPTSRL